MVQTILALRIPSSLHPWPARRRERNASNDLSRESGCGRLARMLRQGFSVGVLASVLLLGCAYPRRSTPLSAVSEEMAKTVSAPANLWRLVLVRADIPPHQRSGLAWDDDG